MPRWGVCATVKAPVDQVLAFVAHHRALGAERIWIHLDDPDDPAVAVLEPLKGVRVIRCTDDYWQRSVGRRPPTHQLRQFRNVNRCYHRARVDFLAHLDVDEYLLADRPVAEVLADLPEDRLILRVEPWEALHTPGLPDDIFTARHFRRQMPGPDPALAARLFGRFAPLLEKGMLSHTVGKCFFRTGEPRLKPNIHGARIEGERVFGGRFSPDLALLHFHAEDPARWQKGLAFRLSKGAYQFLPDLQAHLLAADAAEIAAFYDMVQTARPEALEALREAGLLREHDLGLRAKVAAL
ncbi:glycosyltransferase family 2 protein [Ruixingdingia sedimenti]|uniref:Glycosyltransferase family 2 protein n=1 Tax=Ruixingdingia sedimenti TaxID=3073604 RepID=A0ABU1F7J9_9RHOB|nr:glycosyltransferase family 2 protein [Xinfangfangia sp. LG-4]MDR5652837.1 glycosyltransferase family 2 protein [Xinfangfangia sp. LG-4]